VELDEAIEHSVGRLSVDTALSAIGGAKSRRKWSGPWWHMALLCEMEAPELIPDCAIANALTLLKHSTWPKFVIGEENKPLSEEDRAKMDCCHCELAVFYMVLSACGCDMDAETPWIRPWLLTHQLPDGGLNCSPDAYSESRKSSVVSTLPPLEALLRFTGRELTAQERTFLDEGARYLIEHRLCRVKGRNDFINPEWLKPIFPRFFEYDVLRGMSYLVAWAERRQRPLPREVLLEGLALLEGWIVDDQVRIGTRVFGERGRWESDEFPLLELVGSVGTLSPYLSREYARVRAAVEPS
jgi:hypothetical protein